MKNNNFGYSSGDGYGHGFSYGYGNGFGDSSGFGFSSGFGYGFSFGAGFGDTDNWIKIGQIGNKNVSVLLQWSYMKIGEEIKTLESWNNE